MKNNLVKILATLGLIVAIALILRGVFDVGKIGFNELSVYASSKGAIDSLTKSLATEMSENNIRVNSISPGFTKSSFYLKFKKKKKLFNWTLNRTPMKRWAETSEISSVISFLISEKSSYINGENINVDGGWLSS